MKAVIVETYACNVSMDKAEVNILSYLLESWLDDPDRPKGEDIDMEESIRGMQKAINVARGFEEEEE